MELYLLTQSPSLHVEVAVESSHILVEIADTSYSLHHTGDRNTSGNRNIYPPIIEEGVKFLKNQIHFFISELFWNYVSTIILFQYH